MTPSWQQKFIDLAALVGSWSHDPSTKVGAVCVDSANRVLGIGYNGFPVGCVDTPERLADRPTKYLWTVHAEANLVATAARNGISLLGSTLIVTALHPCNECAKLIIQAGIVSVHAPLPDSEGRWASSFEIAATMLAEGGVAVEFY